MKTFTEVAGEALEETREKFQRSWRKDAQSGEMLNAVNYALGLFSGIVMRRMRGEPDPDKREKREQEKQS